MRTFALLFLGVVIGWVASAEWSVEAVGLEADSITGKPINSFGVPELSSNRAQIVDAARASESLEATTQAKIEPQWNSAPNDGPRRVFETRMEVDANGQQRPVTVSRLVNADGSIVPEMPQGLVGRFQATAYGSPSGHGCFVVDTMTGKTWHVAPGVSRQLMSDALIQPSSQAPVTTPVPTQAYGAAAYGAPLAAPPSQSPEPNLENRAAVEPPRTVVPTPVPQLAEPESDDAN